MRRCGDAACNRPCFGVQPAMFRRATCNLRLSRSDSCRGSGQVDGILQASPYVAVLFVVPCNYLTHMVRPTVTPAPLPAARMIRTLRLRSLVRVRLALRSPGFVARVPLNCPPALGRIDFSRRRAAMSRVFVTLVV